MNQFSDLVPSLILTTATLILNVPSVVALEPAQISALAKQFVVQIGGEDSGSGVIIEHQGNTYKVLTNWHVMDTQGNYEVKTIDAKTYKVDYKKVKYLTGLDLAVIEFTSSQTYTVAKLGDSKQATEGTSMYLAGYPAPFPGVNERTFVFLSGQVVSRLSKPEKGYQMMYDKFAPPGSSGGAILNNNGDLIAINGRFASDGNTGAAFGQGIPIEYYLAAVNTVSSPIASPPPTTPDNEDYVSLGKKKAKDEDYQGAITLYNKALAKNPNDYEAYYERATAYYWLDNYPAAIEDLNQVIKINPSDAVAYFRRGYARQELKDYQRAIEDYNQAIRLNPNDAVAYNNRGNAYSDLGEKQKALEDYNQAIRLNSNYADAYNNRGNTYRRLGETQKEIEDYNQAIRLDPNDALAYNNRGIVYKDRGDKAQAISDFQKAAQLYQQQGSPQDYQDAIDRIRELRNN